MKQNELQANFESMNNYIKDKTKEIYLKIRKECKDINGVKREIDILEKNARYHYPYLANLIVARLRRMLDEEISSIRLP